MPKANERIRRQSEQEREAGLPKNNITNKQKTLIKQLIKKKGSEQSLNHPFLSALKYRVSWVATCL